VSKQQQVIAAKSPSLRERATIARSQLRHVCSVSVTAVICGAGSAEVRVPRRAIARLFGALAGGPLAGRYFLEGYAALMSSYWEIIPIELGRRDAHQSWFFFLSEDNVRVEIAYWAWLLRSDSSLVLVDTGPPPDEAARRGLRDVVSIDDALKQRGIDPDHIDRVILTHLHWDHAAGCDRLPCARFLIQRAENDFFAGPAHQHPSTGRFFAHREKLEALLDSGRCDLVDGDTVICPGLGVVHVGGHTPGSQMVVVETSRGLAVITGDVVPFARNYEAGIPNGILVNLLDSLAALRRIRQLEPALVYPGHDVVPCLEVARLVNDV
jgi:glyoxylase-like metal-dependent hydrolase (beta-lactamase superfamily II)